MGRIKTKLIKRVTLKVFSKHANELSKEFDNNKEILTKFVELPSKKMKNVIAGYLTRLRKAEQR
ncbi:MAG: 30S ribosomal protein S17e [Candidatus Woesearchaeota archaeon]